MTIKAHTRYHRRSPSSKRAQGDVTPADGNIFSDLGFPPEEAENLRIRSQLMGELRAIIDAQQLTQTSAAERFGVSQPRVSDLVRGKIGLFTIDALVNMLTHAGADVQIRVIPKTV